MNKISPFSHLTRLYFARIIGLGPNETKRKQEVKDMVIVSHKETNPVVNTEAFHNNQVFLWNQAVYNNHGEIRHWVSGTISIHSEENFISAASYNDEDEKWYTTWFYLDGGEFYHELECMKGDMNRALLYVLSIVNRIA